jgi:homoserine O-acetyltransferase
MDALGNGVSASPSNSRLQPRMWFRKFTICDAVETQHELLTKVQHLGHLKAAMAAPRRGCRPFSGWFPRLPSKDQLEIY